MTIQDTAHHLGVSWDVVKEIQKRYLQRRFSRPKLGKLKEIAIDEISIGKRHRYLTVVLDLKSGAVVFVGDGKGADALDPFWKRLRYAKGKIKAVSIDMSPAYISAILKNLPDAKIVFDHFHVIKLFNDKLSELRRQLYHEVNDILQKQAIKEPDGCCSKTLRTWILIETNIADSMKPLNLTNLWPQPTI